MATAKKTLVAEIDHRENAVLYSINPQNPQRHLIAKIAQLLREGAVISYPTDTVYGLGCDILNQKAIKRIYQIKRRPQHKPFSFMCSSLKDVSRYAGVSNAAYRIMKKNLPGPYTFVLQGTRLVPKLMMTKQKTVGIRVPDNRICLDLLEALGNPILNTSAALEDGQPPSEAFEIDEQLGKLIDLVIDGGPVYPQPSSVVSLIEETPIVLREGKGDVSQFTARP